MVRIPLYLLAALTLGGCALTPRVDRHFGESVRMASAQQTLNPQAWRNTAPVAGMDGRSAEAVYEQYQKSYSAPQPHGSALTTGTR